MISTNNASSYVTRANCKQHMQCMYVAISFSDAKTLMLSVYVSHRRDFRQNPSDWYCATGNGPPPQISMWATLSVQYPHWQDRQPAVTVAESDALIGEWMQNFYFHPLPPLSQRLAIKRHSPLSDLCPPSPLCILCFIATFFCRREHRSLLNGHHVEYSETNTNVGTCIFTASTRWTHAETTYGLSCGV